MKKKGSHMITYALSAGSFGQITPSTASAVRQSKFRNFEPYLGFFAEENDLTRESAKLMQELIREGVFRTASMHLPYNGNLYWDPSAADETVRRDVSERLIALIRKHADLMGPMATLHPAAKSPLALIRGGLAVSRLRFRQRSTVSFFDGSLSDNPYTMQSDSPSSVRSPVC